MYVQALCSGLESVLEPYRQTLIDLEKSILKNKSAQLSFIQHKIFPYQPVMRNICGLLHQIEYRQAHGCFILDYIYKVCFIEKWNDYKSKRSQKASKNSQNVVKL